MKRHLPLVMLLAVATPALAQSTSDLKRELRAMEKAAKGDADGMCEAAIWAKNKGLSKEAEKLLKKVLKLDADHKGANEAMGNVRYEDEWMPKEDADEKRMKALEAKYKKEGLEKVGGVWVQEEHKADAKRGIFHHDGSLVTKADKVGLMAGQIRHPRTGVLIDPTDAEKAETQFPSSKGWLSEADANKYHNSSSRPWVIRTDHATIMGPMKIEVMEKVAAIVDSAIANVRPWFGETVPLPEHRPVILLTKNTDYYREAGNAFGGAGSTYGAFISLEPQSVPGFGTRWLACANWGEANGWNEYYTRHAAGMAYITGLARSASIAEPPLWLVRGVGARAERFSNRGIATHYANQCLNNGGLDAAGAFFNGFDINSEMSSEAIGKAIFQSGFMVDYSAVSDDETAKGLLGKVTEALADRNGPAATKAIEALEQYLRGADAKLAAYYQAMLKG